MNKLTIIIAAFKCHSWTLHCLEHIKKNTFSEYDLFITDNGCQEKMSQSIKEFNPKILIKNNKNMGSYYAWNAMLNYVDTEYVAIIDTDCLVSNGWDIKMINLLEKDKNISAVCAMTNYCDSSFYLNISQSMFNEYVKMKPSNKIDLGYQDINYLLEEYYMFDGGFETYSKKIHNKFKESFRYLSEMSTHCIIFRTKTLQKLDCFDSDFYPHKGAEKVLLNKMQSHGLDCVAALGCYVHHHGNATSDGGSFNVVEMTKKNYALAEKKMLVSFV